MLDKKFILVFLLCLSLLGNAGLTFLLFNNVYAISRVSQTQQVNLKILSFTNLFIEKVLMSDKEVDLDTRLALETMVRNLNDQQVLGQWQKFTQAPDTQTASQEAKVLLDILNKKISY